MLLHPVVDSGFHSVRLDLPSAVLYAFVFVVVVAVTLRRPAYGVAALIALMPFAFYREIGPTTLTLSKAALVAVMLGLALRRSDLSVLRAPAARALLACALLVAGATALTIVHAAFRGAALRETFKSVEYLAVFAAAVVATRADVDERPLHFAFVAALGAVSLLAIAQEVLGAPSGMWLNGHPIPRVAGPLEGPNQLSGYLGIALCAVAAFALRAKGSAVRMGALALPTVALGTMALGIAALVLTLSRTGLPAALAGLAVVVAVSPRRPTRAEYAALAGGLIFGIAVLAAWGITAARFGDVLGHYLTVGEAPDPGSVGTRSQLWHAAMVLWRAHPIFGIGAGNFELELGLAGYPHLRTHANSLYLQSLVEGSVPLFAATLLLVGTSIGRFARGPFGEPLVVAALAASTGFALHQTFDLLVFYPKVGEVWWILLGLGAARFDAVRSDPAPFDAPRSDAPNSNSDFESARPGTGRFRTTGRSRVE